MPRVCFFDSFDKSKLPRSRVELHLHLDGSFRISTIWDLAKKKGIETGYDTLAELKDALIMKHPSTLKDMLDRFQIFMPVFVGDGDAIERAAYELCEDQANQGALYFEARYSPQGMSNVRTLNPDGKTLVDPDSPEAFTPRQVVQSVSAGLRRGEEDFGVKSRSILCCIRGIPQWNEEVLELCKDMSPEGVVGIDIAGNEVTSQLPETISDDDVTIFQKAAFLGIHRTVHAGEVGPAVNVDVAVHKMLAERIGHGYRVLEDPVLYKDLLDRAIHLETCPNSSLLTGAVPMTTHKHPIVRFCEDGANFSINKDDPTVIGNTLNDEYKMLRNMGLDESHFCRANFNAARSCFLPPAEKQQLIEQLQEIYKCK